MPTYYVLIRANCKYWDFRPQEAFSLYNGFVIGSSGLCKRMIQSQRILFIINQRTLTCRKRLRQSPRSRQSECCGGTRTHTFLTHFCWTNIIVYILFGQTSHGASDGGMLSLFSQNPSALFTWSILCHLVASSLSRLSREKYRTWKFDCQKCYVIMVMKNRKMKKATDRKSRRTQTSSAHRKLSVEFQYVKMGRDTYTDPWRRGESVKGTSSLHRVVRKEDFLLPPPLIWTSHLTLWLNTQRSAFLASSVYYSVMNTVFVKDPEIEIL